MITVVVVRINDSASADLKIVGNALKCNDYFSHLAVLLTIEIILNSLLFFFSETFLWVLILIIWTILYLSIYIIYFVINILYVP